MAIVRHGVDMKKLLMWCLVIFCSCSYTQIHDPLRIQEPEPVKIEPVIDYHYSPSPQIRREYYGRFSPPNYYNNYYPIYSDYYQQKPQVVVVETKTNIKSPTYKMSEPSKEDKARSQKVWQKRVDPRNRKAPQPTPKNK